MEFGGSRGQSSVQGSNNSSGGSTNGTVLGWDVWEPNNQHHIHNNPSKMDWASSSSNPAFYGAREESAGNAPPRNPASLYGGGGSQMPPNPHLVCLKLGKRHYFEDQSPADGIGKKGKAALIYGGAVPRCQVEGCHVALLNAKDYHRRHKVCEVHSKAPKVIVLGLEQRFCQQCSRFHVVSEFEEAKRSCKRRLAGHNERRRKSSNDPIARNPYHENKMVMLGSGFPYMLGSEAGRAHSLLSSKSEPVFETSDLSSRSSAALRELIAEHRAAAILARQLHQDFAAAEPQRHVAFAQQPPGWDRLGGGSNLTLDLMQGPNPGFGFDTGSRAAINRTKDEDEDCCDLWSSF